MIVDQDLAFAIAGKACLSALITSSVTISPRLTEMSASTLLASAVTSVRRHVERQTIMIMDHGDAKAAA